MGKIALFGNFPMLEWIYKGGPMILLKKGDRQVEVVQARRIQGKFFSTPEGVFELDGEYEYRLNDQSCYIYNLNNSKPISLEGVEVIQKLWRENKAEEITKELTRISMAVDKVDQEDNMSDPVKALNEVIKAKSEQLSQKTQKFLIDYCTFDWNDIRLFNIDKMNAKFVSGGGSYKVYTMAPLMLLSGIGLGIVVVMRFFNPLRMFPEFGNAFVNSIGKFIGILGALT